MAQAQIEARKILKAEHTSRKLWAHEGRLFDEKFIYLNRSTTKYVTVGLEPEFYEPRIRICDRLSGNHITLKIESMVNFYRLLTYFLMAKLIHVTK